MFVVGFLIAIGLIGPEDKKEQVMAFNSQKQCGYNHHDGVAPGDLINKLWRRLMKHS